MKKHLMICAQIEELAGQIYRQMSTSPQLTTAVRQTLIELAKDEDDHANQLRFAQRFPDGSMVNSVPEMLKKAEELKAQAERLLERVSKTEVGDQQAINLGVELERKFCQVHIANSFDFTTQQLRDMFSAMARADEQHCQRLLDLQKTLV